ncbi:spp-11 [Symbiodinium microadriaticum]|nr:spp-11 [Symbiodinium microadriaticum]
MVSQDGIQTQPAVFPTGGSSNPSRESGLMHGMSSGSITSEGASPACPLYPRATGPPQAAASLSACNAVPPPASLTASQVPTGLTQVQPDAVPNQLPAQVPLPSQSAGQVQPPSQPSEVPLFQSQPHEVPNQLPSPLWQPHVPCAGQVQPPTQVPTQVPLPSQPHAFPDQLQSQQSAEMRLPSHPHVPSAGQVQVPTQVPTQVPLLSQPHAVPNQPQSQAPAEVPLPSQPLVHSTGQVQPPTQVQAHVPLLSLPHTVPNQLPSQVPAQKPLHSQPTQVETQVPLPSQAHAVSNQLPPRQLQADFDAAAFEKELEQQMEIDVMSEQRECRKRKFASDLQDLEEQSKNALLKHREFLRGLDEEYNERCRKHKLEMIRLLDEERVANQQAKAAKTALDTAAAGLAKQQLQEKLRAKTELAATPASTRGPPAAVPTPTALGRPVAHPLQGESRTPVTGQIGQHLHLQPQTGQQPPADQQQQPFGQLLQPRPGTTRVDATNQGPQPSQAAAGPQQHLQLPHARPGQHVPPTTEYLQPSQAAAGEHQHLQPPQATTGQHLLQTTECLQPSQASGQHLPPTTEYLQPSQAAAGQHQHLQPPHARPGQHLPPTSQQPQPLQATAGQQAAAAVQLVPANSPSSLPVTAATPSPADMPSTPSPAAVQDPQQGFGKVSSSTHPAAWQFLYRLTNTVDKAGNKKCSQEMWDAWREPSKRDKLLHDFVHRCWKPQESHQDNKTRLDCLVRLRAVASQWRTCLVGYEWLTERQMRDIHKWDENTIAGAKEYCTKRKLVKRCLYSADSKFLVQTSDRVETGDSRTKTLEQELAESGLFDTEWSVGDILGLDDSTEGAGEANSKPTKLSEFPEAEGNETLQEYLGQYKKAALNKKAVFKTTKDRLQKDNPTSSDYEHDLRVLEAVRYFRHGVVNHPFLSVFDFARFLLGSEAYAGKLLAGYRLDERDKWQGAFKDFWASVRLLEPEHEVFQRHSSSLHCCVPVVFHGDEGTSVGKRGLFEFSWSPVLSIGESGLSRYFMISQIPYKYYGKLAKGNEAGNPALDSIMKAGVDTMLQAFIHGVHCGNDKLYLVPVGLCGDSSNFIRLDTFHLGALGTGQYLAPSVLCMLVAKYKHFKPLRSSHRDVESRLAVAHEFFLAFCNAKGKSPRDLKDFTKSNMHWPDQATYPMLTCKAADTILMLGWLEDYMTSLPLDLSDHLLQLSLDALLAYNSFFRLCYSSQSRVWWTHSEATTGLMALTTFLRSYHAAAVECYQRQWSYYNFVPKMHYLAHIALSIYFALSQGKPVYNPSIWATQMAEDYVGSMCKMSANVNPTSIARRGIDKYLVRARRLWLKEAAEKQACAG